jgi:hypothetical protein
MLPVLQAVLILVRTVGLLVHGCGWLVQIISANLLFFLAVRSVWRGDFTGPYGEMMASFFIASLVAKAGESISRIGVGYADINAPMSTGD